MPRSDTTYWLIDHIASHPDVDSIKLTDGIMFLRTKYGPVDMTVPEYRQEPEPRLQPLVAWTLRGTVKKGLQIAQTLNYPTANLEVPHDHPHQHQFWYGLATTFDVANIPAAIWVGKDTAEIHLINYRMEPSWLYDEELIFQAHTRVPDVMIFQAYREMQQNAGNL